MELFPSETLIVDLLEIVSFSEHAVLLTFVLFLCVLSMFLLFFGGGVDILRERVIQH